MTTLVVSGHGDVVRVNGVVADIILSILENSEPIGGCEYGRLEIRYGPGGIDGYHSHKLFHRKRT